MSALKMFRFRVRNETTKETTEFLGQGTTMFEAMKDGVSNASDHKLAVTSRDGKRVINRSVTDFEGEVAADYFAPSS